MELETGKYLEKIDDSFEGLEPEQEEEMRNIEDFKTLPLKGSRGQQTGLLVIDLDGEPQLARYKIRDQTRGLCLIINNLKFENDLVCRNGAEKDEAILADLFGRELSFDIEVKKDLTRDEIIKAAEEYGQIDHSRFDAFVFIIMTHGNHQDSIFGVDGRKARVEDIMTEFNGATCKSLRGKPKLFFIQACRGSPFIWPDEHSDYRGCNSDSTLSRGLCPQEADFLLAFSTAPGYLSWRDETGTRFIQVLVSVIKKYHKRNHLLDMLVEVTRQVVEKGKGANNSQVPAPTNTLRAQVFL